jgi:hypothetical protein
MRTAEFSKQTKRDALKRSGNRCEASGPRYGLPPRCTGGCERYFGERSMTPRRGVISGIGAVICAPAIVRASSLMKINSRLAMPVRVSSFPPARAAAIRIIGPIHIFADDGRCSIFHPNPENAA